MVTFKSGDQVVSDIDKKVVREENKRKRVSHLKSGLKKLGKSFGSSSRKFLHERGRADVTRATGSYILKIAKLRLPKGYHNPIPERYDTIPIEYLKPSFVVPRYQQDLENERYKQRKQKTQEELASESEGNILNAKNVLW